MSVLLDTSCLVSLYLEDIHSSSAKAVLEMIVEGKEEGLLSALSLAELCGVIRRNTDRKTAEEVKTQIETFISSGILKVIPLRAVDAAAASMIAISTGLKGADAIIVQAAVSSGANLFTFDEEIKKKAAGIVTLYSMR